MFNRYLSVFLVSILVSSCSTPPNGLICYDTKSKKEVFSLLINKFKSSGFVKWSGKGAGSEWGKVDLEITPDKIGFNQNLITRGFNIEMTGEINTRTLRATTSVDNMQELTIESECKTTTIEEREQKI